MISAGIIKIDRALDQTQPEQSDVKIEVALRIAGDGSDVVQSNDFLVHGGLPISIRLLEVSPSIVTPPYSRRNRAQRVGSFVESLKPTPQNYVENHSIFVVRWQS
jgi:hypothetical protein